MTRKSERKSELYSYVEENGEFVQTGRWNIVIVEWEGSERAVQGRSKHKAIKNLVDRLWKRERERKERREHREEMREMREEIREKQEQRLEEDRERHTTHLRRYLNR